MEPFVYQLYVVSLQAFLRLFDCEDHDIAQSTWEVESFIEMLDALFVRGHVFTSPHQHLARTSALPTPIAIAKVGGTSSADRPGFITEHVQTQIQRRCVFRAGGLPVLLWGPCSQPDLRELSHRMQNVAKTVIARLQVEFPGDCIRAWLQCFDVRQVRIAYGGNEATPELCDKAKKSMIVGVAKLARSLELEAVVAVMEYRDVTGLVVSSTSPGQSLAAADNRKVWSQFLAPGFLEKALPSRAASFRVLPLLIAFYNSIEDGECQVERDLGCLRAVMQAHSFNADAQLLDEKLIIKCSGPKDTSEVCAMQFQGGPLRLTSFSRECAVLWRDVHGARLGCYDVKRTGKKLLPRRGTWVSRKRGVLDAACNAVVSARSAVVTRANPTTAFGVAHSFFTEMPASTAGTSKSTFWNKRFSNFDKLTARKGIQNTMLARTRRLTSTRFTSRPAAPAPPQEVRVKNVCFVGRCAPECTAPRCHVVEGTHRCRQSDMVVVDDVATLHMCADDRMLANLVYIIGLGKKVVPMNSWLLAEKNPENISRGSVIYYKAACEATSVTFRYEAAFETRHHRVVTALRSCAAAPRSKWLVQPNAGRAASSGAAQVFVVGDVQPLAEWLREHTRISHVLGPKLLNAP